jgi:hypothetical protein
VPRSIFLGRPWPQPGEPLFTAEDTAYAMALAEEERDTCHSCGYPKAWCRDPANQFGAFEPHEEFCWATYRLSDHRKAKHEAYSDAQRESVQLSARFRKGREPDFDAGLDLDELGPSGDTDQHDQHGQHG